MKQHKKVLITDGQWRKALSATRSLGREGIDVAATGDTFFTTTFFSKYCRKKLVFPTAQENKDLFLQNILREIINNNYDVLMPMEDESVASCIENREIIEKYVKFPFPSQTAFNQTRDKAQTIKIAQKLGIPVPKTYFISSLGSLTKLAKQIKFPLIVKPRIASGSHGLQYVEDKTTLVNIYKNVHKFYPWPLIQECIPREGVGHGAGFLFNKNNKAVASFAYKRLREYPVQGGPSTLRESIQNKELIAMGETLLKKIGWYGVAMVEFKHDPRDNKYKLMEINPRFWGSLELAVVAGVNFPLLLYKLALGEKFKPVFNYKVGVRCRWLLPGDILHFLSNPNRFKLKPSFFNFWDQKTKYDIISLDDPGAIGGRLLAMFYAFFNPKMWKYVKR